MLKAVNLSRLSCNNLFVYKEFKLVPFAVLKVLNKI